MFQMNHVLHEVRCAALLHASIHVPPGTCTQDYTVRNCNRQLLRVAAHLEYFVRPDHSVSTRVVRVETQNLGRWSPPPSAPLMVSGGQSVGPSVRPQRSVPLQLR